MSRHLVVVGAGVTGLAAAHRARTIAPDATVTVVESSTRIGGRIRTSPFAGLAVDEGADAFLARVPWGRELCDELGLAAELVAPAATRARLWLDGELRDLPPSLIGVPLDVDGLAGSGVLTPAGIVRLREDLDRTSDPTPRDESVGAMVRRRLGDEVLERLVGPLVGGINAGDADRLSLRATAPQLAEAADADPSLLRGVQKVTAASGRAPDAPVFLAPRGGMEALVDALGAEVADRVLTGTPVRSVRPTGAGATVHTDSTAIDADRCILAVPAPVAAGLVGEHPAAPLLSSIEQASVVMVTLAFDPAEVPVDLDGSGFLVPEPAGLAITACSWASSKWAHLGGGPVILRVSLGRDGDEPERPTEDETASLRAVQADLETTMGIVSEPWAVRVTPWPASMPQYRPGHLDLVAEIDDRLGAHLLAAGASYRGLGIPACIEQGRGAAEAALA